MKGYRVPDPPPVDPVAARVEAILADAELEREESEASKVDELEKFYQECGWDPVRNYLMSILENPARSVEDWTTIAAVFWGAVLDRLPVSNHVANRTRHATRATTRFEP